MKGPPSRLRSLLMAKVMKLINCIRNAAIIAAAVGVAAAASAQVPPTLNISILTPGVAEISWPTNFTGWQLMSAFSLTPPVNWQPVPGSPFPLGNSMVTFVSITNRSSFFRLQVTNDNGGGCVFHATPPIIQPGGSSVLSWCPVAGTTYILTPGPGVVTGSNFVVSPTLSTLYTLISSNLSGVTSNFTEVSVTTTNTCDFGKARSYDCTLRFLYSFSTNSSSYLFNINQQGDLSFHLTPSLVNTDTATFVGDVGGTAQINDLEDALTVSPPNNITTVTGSEAPDSSSVVELEIDCKHGTYSLHVTPAIHANWTQSGGTGNLLTIVGTVFLVDHPFPSDFGPLAGSATIPAHTPAVDANSDFYYPNGIAQAMFTNGTVTETTAGTAAVTWSFVPNP